MVCNRGQDLPFRALANDIYEKSEIYARLHPEAATNADRSSLNRFCTASQRVTDFRVGSDKNNMQYAFDTLDQVSQGKFTVWSIVYDIPARRIQYRTHNNPQTRSLDFSVLNFSCGGPAVFRDIEAKNGAEFRDLTKRNQLDYLESFIGDPALQQRFGDLTPQVSAQLRMLDGFHCDEHAVGANQQIGEITKDHPVN